MRALQRQKYHTQCIALVYTRPLPLHDRCHLFLAVRHLWFRGRRVPRSDASLDVVVEVSARGRIRGLLPARRELRLHAKRDQRTRLDVPGPSRPERRAAPA